VEEEIIEDSPVTAIKPPVCRADQIQPFTSDQVNALLKAAERSKQPQRNKALLLFLLDTGARASELVRLKM
jgi:site-specific recombinase XerD